MIGMLKIACRTTPPVGRREALLAAAVMLGVSIAGAAVGVLLDRSGWESLGEFVITFSFFVGLQISTLIMYLQGQPRRVQVVLTVGPLAIVGAIIGLAYAL